MMKVIIVGGTGTIGAAIANELKKDTEVIIAGSSSGDIQVDITNTDSIISMYQAVPDCDAVITAAGRGVKFAPLTEMTVDDYNKSMQSKLLGQINIVLQGIKYAKPTCSFTLTTGLLNVDTIPLGSAAAMVNAAVEGFIKAAADEVPQKQRINAVSPALLTESLEQLGDYFQGHETVSSDKVALSYRKSVYSLHTGRVYKVGW